MMHSILILGQSNMGGRGRKEEIEPIVNPNIYVLRNGRWRAMAQKDAKIGFARAEGLTDNGDFLHFNAGSLYEFGKRYYAEFVKLEDKNKVFEEKPGMDEVIVQNWMELL